MNTPRTLAKHPVRVAAPVLAGIAITLLLLVRPAAAAPGNDAFASAMTAATLPFQYSAANTSATIEPSEPQPCIESLRTVWYRFTAPASGVYEVDTFGSDFDTVLAVYTGSTLPSLSLVDCNDDTLSSIRSRVQFQAVGGVTYMVQAGGWGTKSGILTVNIGPSPPPPANDGFAQAAAIPDVPFGDARFNSTATEDAGELKTTCSDVEKTVWYTFTPPASGVYAIDTAGSEFDTVLTVFTGASLDTLAQIACNDDIGEGIVQSRIELSMLAGTAYRIQAGGFSGWRGGAGADFGRLVLSISVPLPGDSDGDGCPDAAELGAAPDLGGDRSPYFYWDFYDVTGNGAVDLDDTLLILAHFGHAPDDDPIDRMLDRTSANPSKPWRTAPQLAPSDGVTLDDALASLASFGHGCAGAPVSTGTPPSASPTPTSTRTRTPSPSPTRTPSATPTPTPGCVDTDRDSICNTADPDDDNDGCADTRELGAAPDFGGMRDPLVYWDFYDVTGNQVIDLDDALDVLSYFGNAGTGAGNIRDRLIPDESQPWRTAESNDGVDLTDVLFVLQSFGHSCN